MCVYLLPACGDVQIMKELQNTYKNYGIELDERHLAVLADTMSYRGTVLGITRFGVGPFLLFVLVWVQLCVGRKLPMLDVRFCVHACVGVSVSLSNPSRCVFGLVYHPNPSRLYERVHASAALLHHSVTCARVMALSLASPCRRHREDEGQRAGQRVL